MLSIIRQREHVAKAEIARATGLSPQTISIITNQLTRDGLLLRGDPMRGRVGQPLVPYSLNPEGAYSFGLKIGRRSAELLLIDFLGNVVGYRHETFPYPMPDGIRAFATDGIESLLESIDESQRERIAGLGIAAPYEIWSWPEEIGAPLKDIDTWRHTDIQTDLAKICHWPVYYSNDITAACAAELLFGSGSRYIDYLYLFVGSFLGGGLVLNGHLFPGRTQNAAAIGSVPANTSRMTPDGRQLQMMHVASIYTLERTLVAQGRPADVLWRTPDAWGELGPALDSWIAEVSHSLAFAIVAAIAVVDTPTVVLDGAFPADVRARVAEETRAALARFNCRGISPFEIVEGTIGHAARALGGATIPLMANFSLDREVLFKDAQPD